MYYFLYSHFFLVLRKISALSGLGMVLTKVKTDEQFSYVHVYWSANTVENGKRYLIFSWKKINSVSFNGH